MAGIGPSITANCPALCNGCTAATKAGNAANEALSTSDEEGGSEASNVCSVPDPAHCESFDVEMCTAPGIGPSVKGSCPALCGGCVTGATLESPSVDKADDRSEAMAACAEADPMNCEGIDASACTMPEVAESVIAMCPSLCGACGDHIGGGGSSSGGGSSRSDAEDGRESINKPEEAPAQLNGEAVRDPDVCTLVHPQLCVAAAIGMHIKSHCPLRCEKVQPSHRNPPPDVNGLLPHSLCLAAAGAGCSVAVFDGNLESFWKQTYGQTWKHIKAADVVPGSQKGDHIYCAILGLKDCRAFENVHAIAEAVIASWRRSGSRIEALSMRTSKGVVVPDEEIDTLVKGMNAESSSSSEIDETNPQSNSNDRGGTTFAAGFSLIARLEEWDLEKDIPESIRVAAASAASPSFSDPIPPLFGVMLETARLFGHQTSGHIYVAGADGVKTLKPHTDPYDVYIVQLAGAKNWTTCVPQGKYANSGLSDAELSLYQEVSTGATSSLTVSSSEYSLAKIEALGCKCSNFMMEPGDTLYMPVGTIHHATTEGWSVHYTMGLTREGASWGDLIQTAVETMATENQTGVHDALFLVSKEVYGLTFRDSVPMLKEIIASGGDLASESKELLVTMYGKLVELLESALSNTFGKLEYFPTGMRKGLEALRGVDVHKVITTFISRHFDRFKTRMAPPAFVPPERRK